MLAVPIRNSTSFTISNVGLRRIEDNLLLTKVAQVGARLAGESIGRAITVGSDHAGSCTAKTFYTNSDR